MGVNYRKLHILTLLIYCQHLFVTSIRIADYEDHILQGINSFRQSKSVPALAKHDKADCLADKIANEIEDQPCPRAGTTTTTTGAPPQLANYPDLVKKCDIDINTTRNGVILPVCVHDRVSTLVLTNYTQTQNARFLNDSRYTGVGVGKEDDWTVLVLTTNTPGGQFQSAAVSYNVFDLGFYMLCLFSALFSLLVT